ncbi:MAG: fatty acid desaturase [Acidobacteria bacterium]|nr:fatty acid desaturase [Acidobacteriota bacterium]
MKKSERSNDATINFRQGGFNRQVFLFMLFVHSVALTGLFNFSWAGLGVAVLMWWVAGSLGIGIGYHRLLTHRGFKTPKWVEYILTVCGTLAFEGGPIAWVATHRIHHMYTEREGDPHSPRDGFWWSHMGWILNGNSLHREIEITARHAADLSRDSFYLWLSRWHFLPPIIVATLLYLLGGWEFVLWGVFVRIVFSWHATWFVNSASHYWGGRRFNTLDDSRNNWWVALISFGEGWHNNHHAHPSAARHGLTWYEIDVNWYGIWLLKKLGLAKKIRVSTLPKNEQTDALQEAA